MVEVMQGSDIWGTVLWFAMLFVFMFVYPRMMLPQMLYGLEQSAQRMESMYEKANALLAKKADKGGKRKEIDEFTDFFVVEPLGIDPYGLVKKVDQTIRNMEDRFVDFVDSITIGKNHEHKQRLNYGLRAAIGLRQISKTVRHFVEMARKFKNLQIAMILQMQMPIIEKIAESELRGAEAFVNGIPVGDSIGPLVAAGYMKKSRKIGEGVVTDRTEILGRDCFILKAEGPYPNLGREDIAINAIMKKHRISRIVTIDAGQKLEGEKSGSAVEGVGFAMAPVAQRQMREDTLLTKKIPIDGVVIKVGMEEAIMPLRRDIYKSVPKARELVERAIERAKRGQKVIIVGVGNTTGIGNSRKDVEDVGRTVEEVEKIYKKQEAENKKGGWF